SPDIVLTVRGVTRPQTIERLKRLGINVVVVDESRTFDDIVANFIRLSEIVGKRDLAEKIVVTIRKKVKAVADKTKNSTPIKVFWEINRRPLVTITSSSFMNEFITYSGCENIFNDIRAKHPRVSSEEVLRKNPEVIILASMGDVTIREKEYWQNFKDVEAVKNNRIYVIDADKFCRSTPSNFLMGLEEMASLLYPEIFNLEGQS
ncbi:MAG: ABC transporter substrate-binding protein, partial [Candidatus Omnitrophica bacterium]|nr:ABC transporter substrate-binding protein [Candidatus Omnitrophota bacterium]